MAEPKHIPAEQVEIMHEGYTFRVQMGYNLANLDILDPLVRIARIIRANRDNPVVAKPLAVVGWQQEEGFSESGAIAYYLPGEQIAYAGAYGVAEDNSIGRLQIDKYDAHFLDEEGFGRKTGSLLYFDGTLRFTANTLAYPSAPGFEVPVNGSAVRGNLVDIPGLPSIAEVTLSGRGRGKEIFHFLRHVGWRESDPDNPDFGVRVQAHPAGLGPIAMSAIWGFTDEVLQDLAPLETTAALATTLALSPPTDVQENG